VTLNVRLLTPLGSGLLFVALVQTTQAGDSDWTAVERRDGVVVYERGGGERGPVESKASTVVDATVFEILAFLRDDNQRTAWLDRCIEARSLDQHDRWHRLSYNRFTVWPFSDRDAVVQTRITLGERATSAGIQMRSVESELQPAIPGVVRMPSMRGELQLEQVGRGTRVDFSLSLELGGRLPNRIGLYARRTIPLESLRNLRTLVPSSRDDYARTVRAWQIELSEVPP